ncbi:MAG: O-antigen ligase family protein [Paludibacteraceae bacterium]|nr:O-antigen ligase family protein [Paludibacteraceae bacterium]
MTRLLQVICVVIWCVLQHNNGLRFIRENRFFRITIHAWWIFLIVNTFYQVPTFQLTQIYYWIAIWNFMLMAELYWSRDFIRHLYHIGILFSILIYLNTFLYILFPHGLWFDTEWIGYGEKNRYLFGNYNQTGLIGLVCLLTWGTYTVLSGRGYLNMYCLIINVLAVVVAMGSKTSSVGILLVAGFYMMRRFIKHPFRWIFSFALFYILFFVLIVWQGKDLQDWPLLSDFVVNVLHKDTSFSSRIYLWMNSVKLIIESPIIGYGARNIDWMVENVHGSGPHNLWLMMLLEGGIVSLTLLIVLLTIIFRTLRKQRNTPANFFAVGIATLLLMSLFEAYNAIAIFFIVIIAYYLRCINNPQQEPADKTTNEQ